MVVMLRTVRLLTAEIRAALTGRWLNQASLALRLAYVDTCKTILEVGGCCTLVDPEGKQVGKIRKVLGTRAERRPT